MYVVRRRCAAGQTTAWETCRASLRKASWGCKAGALLPIPNISGTYFKTWGQRVRAFRGSEKKMIAFSRLFGRGVFAPNISAFRRTWTDGMARCFSRAPGRADKTRTPRPIMRSLFESVIIFPKSRITADNGCRRDKFGKREHAIHSGEKRANQLL